METNIATLKIAKDGGELFNNGFHCVEAMVAATAPHLKNISEQELKTAIACSTPFGGGLGKSFQEVCGVISGSAITLGLLYGRHEKGADWDLAAELAATIRQTFLDRNGTTQCEELRKRFGKDHQMQECTKLVQAGIVDLIELLNISVETPTMKEDCA